MSEESLFREVDEEVRQEQYKKLWDRYGNYAVALCLIVVAAVAGFKGWQYFQLRQAEGAAQAYFDAVKAATAGTSPEALKQLEGIGHSGFGQLARMRQAGFLASQGKADEAVKVYDAIAADGAADPALRDAARIRAAYVLADKLTTADLVKRIGDFDKETSPWRHEAREILGIAAWRTGDNVTADRYMNAILADPAAPQGVRERAGVFLQLLKPLLAKS